MIPGGLEITENDLIYVNSSVIVSIGESKEGFNTTEFILVLQPFLKPCIKSMDLKKP